MGKINIKKKSITIVVYTIFVVRFLLFVYVDYILPVLANIQPKNSSQQMKYDEEDE